MTPTYLFCISVTDEDTREYDETPMYQVLPEAQQEHGDLAAVEGPDRWMIQTFITSVQALLSIMSRKWGPHDCVTLEMCYLDKSYAATLCRVIVDGKPHSLGTIESSNASEHHEDSHPFGSDHPRP